MAEQAALSYCSAQDTRRLASHLYCAVRRGQHDQPKRAPSPEPCPTDRTSASRFSTESGSCLPATPSMPDPRSSAQGSSGRCRRAGSTPTRTSRPRRDGSSGKRQASPTSRSSASPRTGGLMISRPTTDRPTSSPPSAARRSAGWRSGSKATSAHRSHPSAARLRRRVHHLGLGAALLAGRPCHAA